MLSSLAEFRKNNSSTTIIPTNDKTEYISRTDASTQRPATAQATAQAQPNQQRSRALFPLLVALAAYLFISRLASIMGGSAGTSTASEI